MTGRSTQALTLAAVTALLGGVGFLARRHFRERLDALDQRLIDVQSPCPPRTDLPPSVLALAARLGADANQPSRYVQFRQHGTMWMKPGGSPCAFTARQCIGTSSSGFVWRAQMGWPSKLAIVDAFVSGHGLLDVRMFGAIPIARIDGTPELTQGEMLRYLAELPLSPDAILFDHALEWSVASANAISVAVGTGDERAKITFGLDDDGMIITASAASRSYNASGQRYPWHGRFWDYQTVHGRLLPMQAEVAWVIDGADFTCWRGTMADWQPVGWANAE